MAKGLAKLHLLPLAELENQKVSRHSRWPDPVWKFDNNTGGGQPVNLYWDFEMPDGSNFMDSKWASLREATQRFEFSLLVDRQSSDRNFKPWTLLGTHSYFREVLRWMAIADFADFGELDNRASKQYLRYIEDSKMHRIMAGTEDDEAIDCELEGQDEQSDESDEPLLTEGGLANYLRPWVLLFRQGPILQEAGVPCPPEAPFDGKSVGAIARASAVRITKTIPAVPDEVYIPTIRKAVEWLGVPARDIIRLQTEYIEQRNKYFELNDSEWPNFGSFVSAFEFSALSETSQPWHEPINSYCRIEDRTEQTQTLQLKRLLAYLRDACVIALQGTMGMRISEVSGLQAYPLNPETGMPACVEIRSSRNGLYDVFYVKGRVYKMHAKWKETEWVAGLRLKGTDYIPPPIQAILVLEELFRPWRDLAGKSELIVSLGSPGLPIKADTVGSISGGVLRTGQNEWIKEFVDLPDEFKDWVVTTHQWRKAFAQHLVMADSRLLRPVSEHFQHVSIAMTENAYVGNDVVLLQMVNDFVATDTARRLYEVGSGKTQVAGRMAEWVEARREQIRAIIAGKTKDEAIEALKQELQYEGVRVYGCEWGWCFYRSEVSRCNHHRGQFLLLAKAPDLAKRNPNTCCSCANLAVTDEHKVFWLKRHQDWSKALTEHKQAGNDGMAFVAQDRVKQCESVLRMMGENVGAGGQTA